MNRPFGINYLHYDQLGIVIAISDPNGDYGVRRTWLPYGRMSWERLEDLTMLEEAKGFLPLSCFD